MAGLSPRGRDEGAQALGHVPADRLIQNWKDVHARAVAYLGALGIAREEASPLATEAIERALAGTAWSASADGFAEALGALRELLIERYPSVTGAGKVGLEKFAAWRLDAAMSGRFDGGAQRGAKIAVERAAGRFPSATPRLSRRAMLPARVERSLVRRLVARLRGRRSSAASGSEILGRRPPWRQRRRLPWTTAALRRRLLMVILVLIPSIVASGFMRDVLPHQGSTPLELTIVIVFGALFGWISIGFWTATLGFLTLAFGRGRFAITRLDEAEASDGPPSGRTAIVMPICDEPVERVFAGLKAIDDSLKRASAQVLFDFFILSDTSDGAMAVQEEAAWAEWCRAGDGFGRIFYRRRRVRLKRKNGNVADFCRRWGRWYRYMVMLDADSVMTGESLARLVRMMDAHPETGMIQTAPVAVNHSSLFARVAQFASRLYGPMFAAGLHFWQLGDGQYWGHNAIVRVEPFTDHCGLAPLPGRPPLGGDIMSHDFVEAALLGRAGWTVWLAYDLPGSYEETSTSLLEEMSRDRRWCQGNLQHLRLLFTEGFFGAHRALFLNGVLSYVSAVLWFIFLALSTANAIVNVLQPPDYFPSGPSLFPEWPIWRPEWALGLMGVTAAILFLPKLLSILLVVFRSRNTRAFGGIVRLVISVVLEVILSSLFAPIRMLFHTKFVLQNLIGRTVGWRSASRSDNQTTWREAIRHHGLGTLLASAWGGSLYWLNPEYFWWVTPIIGALLLSIPLSVLASRVSLGRRARAWGLFLTPEESAPPRELRDLAAHLAEARRGTERLPAAEQDGFVRAVVDPYVNALHLALLRTPRRMREAIRAARRALLERALEQGPNALGKRERRLLLQDPDMVTELHQRVWQLADRERAALWGRPGQAG